MKEIPLTQGKVAIVDDEDYERLSRYKWRCVGGGRTGRRYYALRSNGKSVAGKRQSIMMHHAIMGNPPDGMEADHIDGNPFNNQRTNLRFCTHTQNTHNQGPRKGFSSRYKGVYWHKQHGKWIAAIMAKGQRMCLGDYLNEKDAARAYDVAARKYHGEFAYSNFA